MRALLSIIVILIASTARADAVNDKPLVMVSLPPQAYLVHALAGDSVDVAVLVPKDKNDETYEPTVAQLKQLAQADCYLKLGHPHLQFETRWVEPLARDNAKLRIVDISAGIVVDPSDPHLWLSPATVAVLAKNTAVALVDLVPKQRTRIENNEKTLLAEIKKIDQQLGESLSHVRKKTFLVIHPAWGYFAKQYGLTQIAIEQEGKQPSAATVARIVATAKAEGIHTVFIQPQFAQESAEVVAREINGRVEVLDPLVEDVLSNIRTTGEKIQASLQQ